MRKIILYNIDYLEKPPSHELIYDLFISSQKISSLINEKILWIEEKVQILVKDMCALFIRPQNRNLGKCLSSLI
jgi:hypothetical protein